MWNRNILSILIFLFTCPGCGNDWRTEMWYPPSHRPEDSPRPEPEHSVPLNASPLIVDRDAAETLKNPIMADARSLAHGKQIFTDRCICCHGPEGHGGGPVSKFFPPAPDLSYVTIRERSAGYLFGTVTFGGRAMPAQGEGLNVRDRWDVVNYIRVLQGIASKEKTQ